MPKRSLHSYGFASEVASTVAPIVKALDEHSLVLAEKLIATLALEVCQKIEKEQLTPKQGDDYFTLLNLYLGDNCQWTEKRFSKEITDILFEGQLLHDYGTEYGADLQLIRRAADAVLQRK